MTDRQQESNLTLLGSSRTEVPESPDRTVLEAFENSHPQRDYWIQLNCPEFTSMCPITGQPDFGAITIRYIPDKLCVESKSLKLYLFAYRNHGAFHEAVTNRILDDLVDAIHPRQAVVKGTFNARGGISIEVEACHTQSAKKAPSR